MSGSSLARCLLVEGREQSSATQFWMSPSCLHAESNGGRVRWSLCREEWKKKNQNIRLLLLPARSRRLVDVHVCVMMMGGGTGNSIWGRGGCDNQAQEVISFDRVKCCTCLDYRAMTKWSARGQSISVSFGTDKNAEQLIITRHLFASHVSFLLIKISSQWLPGLHISPEGAG